MATLSLAGPGTIVGIREMLSNEPYGLSAEVLETVEAAYLQRADVLSLLRDEPQAALWMLRALSRENSGLALELCEVVTKLPSAERLLRILQELAQRAGRSAEAGTRIRLPLTVQDLADRVGCSRQWTSRMLGEIESQGLIHRERGWISVAPASR